MKTKEICPRCQGNGFIKVMKSIEEPIEQVLQCTQCDSEGELVIKKEIETYDQE